MGVTDASFTVKDKEASDVGKFLNRIFLTKFGKYKDPLVDIKGTFEREVSGLPLFSNFFCYFEPLL